MTCVFFGHKNTPAEVYPKLKAAIKDMAENKGVRDFYVGNQGTFDRMARRALKELKKENAQINYKVLLAYLPVKKDPCEDYSDTEFPEGIEKVPKRFAINFRNELMVKMADYVIAYVDHSYGGAAKFVDKARRRKAVVVNLAEEN